MRRFCHCLQLASAGPSWPVKLIAIAERTSNPDERFPNACLERHKSVLIAPLLCVGQWSVRQSISDYLCYVY
jgi:hypothetical protein